MISSAKHTFYSLILFIRKTQGTLDFFLRQQRSFCTPIRSGVIHHEPNNCSLYESFLEYFSNKIVKILKDLDKVDGSLNDGQAISCNAESESCLANQLLREFKLVNDEVVSSFMNHLCSKSCTLDPIPSSVFKRFRHYMLPVITRLVSFSLTSVKYLIDSRSPC